MSEEFDNNSYENNQEEIAEVLKNNEILNTIDEVINDENAEIIDEINKGAEIEVEVVEDFDPVDQTDDSSDSEIDLDEIADTTIDIIQMILKPFDIGEITIDEYEGDEGELILDITGDDLAVLIGRHGRTLDALQFIVSLLTRKRLGYRYPVVVDIEGYKSRQRQKIEAMARSAANRAVTKNKEVALRPMNPYERRLVHIALKDDDRVETESKSTGDDRHVVIYPL